MVRGAVLKTVGPKGFAGSSPVSGASGRGGIGRRLGFRFRCLTACGFDSHRPYQTLGVVETRPKDTAQAGPRGDDRNGFYCVRLHESILGTWGVQ